MQLFWNLNGKFCDETSYGRMSQRASSGHSRFWKQNKEALHRSRQLCLTLYSWRYCAGAILTKMDGDSRGGAALSVKAVSGKPIKFVGAGEKLEALEPFYPDRLTSRILGEC